MSHRYAISYGEQYIVADTVTALVAALVPGYGGITQDDIDTALEARLSFAVSLAETVQAALLASAVDGGTDVGEDVARTLLGNKWVPVEAERYDGAVPLILLATDYEPATDRVAPGGNVVFVDPSDERRFLESLSRLGVIRIRHGGPLAPGLDTRRG